MTSGAVQSRQVCKTVPLAMERCGMSSQHSRAAQAPLSVWKQLSKGESHPLRGGHGQGKGEDAVCSCESFQSIPCLSLFCFMGYLSYIGVRQETTGRAGSQGSVSSSSLQALLCPTSGKCLIAKSERQKKGFRLIPEGWSRAAPPLGSAEPSSACSGPAFRSS